MFRRIIRFYHFFKPGKFKGHNGVSCYFALSSGYMPFFASKLDRLPSTAETLIDKRAKSKLSHGQKRANAKNFLSSKSSKAKKGPKSSSLTTNFTSYNAYSGNVPPDILREADTCSQEGHKSIQKVKVFHSGNVTGDPKAAPIDAVMQNQKKISQSKGLLKFLKSNRKKANKFKDDAKFGTALLSSSVPSSLNSFNNADKVEAFSYSKNAPDLSVNIVSQWLDVKRTYPSSYIVLFQVGDFYELYGEDAERGSQLLDLTLSKKNYSYLKQFMPSASNEGGGLSFTGFPVRSIEFYLEKFIKTGHSIVICDQLPLRNINNKGASTLNERIQRKVSRVITPGTITEENLLEKGLNNYILSISLGPHSNFSPGDDKDKRHTLTTLSALYFGLAWMDLSTGYYVMTQCRWDELDRYISKINPKEILIDTEHPLFKFKLKDYLGFQYQIPIAPQLASRFDENVAIETLARIFEKELSEAYLKIKMFSSIELQASSALLDYIFQTQLDKKPFMEFPIHFKDIKYMNIDAQSLKSLELLKHSSSGDIKGSLIEAIDATATASGARLLVHRLQAPLLDPKEINCRLDFIELFTQYSHFLNEIISFLKHFPDLERSVQRLSLNRPLYGPKDMVTVKKAILYSNEIKHAINRVLEVMRQEQQRDFGVHWKQKYSDLLAGQLRGFEGLLWLAEAIEGAIVEPPPNRANEGGLIREDYDPNLYGRDLADCRGMLHGTQDTILELEKKYKRMTKKDSLKIVSGKFFGLLVAVNIKEGEIGDIAFKFDSMTQLVYRYQTAELNEIRIKYIEAEIDKNQLELQIYEKIREKIVSHAAQLKDLSKIIAEFDFASSMAKIALNRKYIRPVVNDSHDFNIIGGRHAVVEEVHLLSQRQFIKNDCSLSPPSRFSLITGPNMGGKSTFLRQNALISIMAQSGCFVPADSAVIGIIDAVFTRVGSGDDLTKDKSTFMTEMMETANILKNATLRSLVIMDEVGRGTSTTEGFSIAWAILHYLYYSNQSRTLFATHYHELGALTKILPNASAYMTTAVIEKDKSIAFLHKLIKGVADQSFGIYVAELAGIPEQVLQMAKDQYEKVLESRSSLLPLQRIDQLESVNSSFCHQPTHIDKETTTFSNAFDIKCSIQMEEIRKKFQGLHLEDITGRQALNILYDLKEMCK